MRTQRALLMGGTVALACLTGAASFAAADGSPHLPLSSAPPVTRAPGERWTWPVAGDRAVIRTFEAPATAYAAGHRGIDLIASEGTAVVAAASGTVSFAGVVVDRPVVSISSPGGLVASIEPVAASVAAGDTVVAGERIGSVATGGHCSSTCAHFGVRLHGQYVNPLALLESLPRAVLLPTDH